MQKEVIINQYIALLVILLWTYSIAAQACSDGNIRLRDGQSKEEGRLELCRNGSWSLGCDNWNTTDAEVICRQLALPETGVCKDGAVRLVDGDTNLEGRVEVCFDQQWGTVCDSDWDFLDAIVICRQLGFPTEGARAECCSSFGAGQGQVFLEGVKCNGSESELAECLHTRSGDTFCTHFDDAGIVCSDVSPCLPGEFQCPLSTTRGSRCIPEASVCNDREDCIGSADENNCPGTDINITVGFVELQMSIREDDSSSIDFCFLVPNQTLKRVVELTITSRSASAEAGIDFRSFRYNMTLNPVGNTTVCHSVEAEDVVIDDLILEDTECFQVHVTDFPAATNEQLIQFDPERSIMTICIVDNEIAGIGFSQAVYSVSESDGEVAVVVQHMIIPVPELTQPIVFMVSCSDGNATGLLDYDQDAALQIGFIDGSIMSTWEFSIPIFDDIIAEGTEVFTVHLLSSDIGVTTVRDVATIAILDDESPPLASLDVYFTENTPTRIEANRIVFQVVTNATASLRCHLTAVGRLDCKPGETVTTPSLIPGTYALRAIATTASERVQTSVKITIPKDANTCTVNLINRGVTTVGSNATVQFKGFGSYTSFLCSLDRHFPGSCSSPLVLTDLSKGAHHLRITAVGCEDSRPLRLRFSV